MDPRLAAFARLLQIMDELRAQCPWDQKQTFETLRNLTIEETYEMADAITDKDYKKAYAYTYSALEPLQDRMNHLIKPEDEFDKKIDMFFNGESELDETNETPN